MQSIAPAPVPQMHQHQHQEMSADNDLRAQLAAAINPSQHHTGPPNPPQHEYDPRASNSASPREHHIDPSMNPGAQAQMMSASALAAGDSGDENGGKGGKRELSQSKRAAQNRAAQRAFRQRKEGYIKKLEEQVRELHVLEDNFKSIQAENYSLREYIIHLQSRLIESQGDMPPPPPNVSLQHPQAGHQAQQAPPPPPQQRHHESSPGVTGPPVAPMTQLQAATARNIAAAGLQSDIPPPKQVHEDPYETSKRFKNDEPMGGTDDQALRAQLQGGPSPSMQQHGLPQ